MGIDGIRVNAVAPGLTDTPALLPQYRALADKVPLKRIGTVEEVVDAILFMGLQSLCDGRSALHRRRPASDLSRSQRRIVGHPVCNRCRCSLCTPPLAAAGRVHLYGGEIACGAGSSPVYFGASTIGVQRPHCYAHCTLRHEIVFDRDPGNFGGLLQSATQSA
jgi:hypothetical protein